MRNYWFLFFIMNLFSMVTSGQTDYYSTANSTYAGIKLINGGDKYNSRFCTVKKGDQLVKYSPYEVLEYGFKNGRIFVSRDIPLPDSSRRVFLERLKKGKNNLYYYRGNKTKKFYWEKDSTLFVELPKHVSDNESKEFNDMLYELTSDCRNIAEVTGLVRYNKKSLTAFITRYNRCDNKPFPHLKFGITGGYAVSKLSSSDAMLKKYSFPYDGSMTIGLFVDVPIMVSNYSFHADITFHQGAYSVYFRDENKNIDLLINTAAISVPFLIRYTYPSVKLSPFINMGGIYAYNFKNENTLYEATIVHDVVEINPVSDEPLLTKSLIGFSAGSGLEYRLNYRHEPGLP